MFKLMRAVTAICCGAIVGLGVWGIAATTSADSIVEDGIREEDRLGARSDQYSRVFDKAISALVRGDGATFRSLLTSTTVLQETRGPGAIDAIIQNVFIPFFADFDELTASISTAPTFDIAGNTGIAIARSFKAKTGEVKSFVIYLVGEKRQDKDVIAVGNLLINATSDVLQRSKSKK